MELNKESRKLQDNMQKDNLRVTNILGQTTLTKTIEQMTEHLNDPNFFPFYIMVKKRKWIFFSKLKFVKIYSKEEYLKYYPENSKHISIGSYLGIYRKNKNY